MSNTGVMENEVETIASTKDEIIAACKQSLNYLAGICIPEVFKYNFPDIFVSIFALLVSALQADRDFSKFAIALPRGHGKSTFLKILIIFTILFTRKKFILIVCATEQLAINILSDVQDILESMNILNIFGNFHTGLETDKQNLKKGFFRGRDIILAGIGSGGSLRGLNIKNSRPDCIFCDDMQTKEEAGSPQVSKQLLGWFQGTLLKAKNPLGCTYLYIGNMYPDLKIGGSTSNLYTCILRNLQLSPQWKSIVVGGILSDGKALWEEVQPLSQLLEELEGDIAMGVGEVFFSEVMNDPQCGVNSTFDISKMPPWDLDTETEFLIGKCLIIDPSLGKKKSDAQIVGEVEVWSDGIPRLVDIHIKQVSGPELVTWALKYANMKQIPLIIAEAQGYQESLLQWFMEIAQREKIEGIEFAPISTGGLQKVTRILQSFKEILEKKIAIGPKCISAWLSQVLSFDPMKKNNVDDILDVVAYILKVFMTYSNQMTVKDFILGESEDPDRVLNVDPLAI
jgi:hypothetical protein